MAWPQEYRSETYCLMKLTARPWCLDFTLHGHSFHDLSDGFFPFLSRASADCDPSSTIGYPRKLFTERKRIGRSRLEIYVLKERKCFSKLEIEKRGWYESLGRKNGKQARSIEPISFILLSFEEDIQPSREERWRAERKGVGGKGKRCEKWKGTPKKPNADCVGLNLVLHPPPQITRPLPLSWSDRTFVSGSRVIRTASRFFFKVTTTSTGQPFIP